MISFLDLQDASYYGKFSRHSNGIRISPIVTSGIASLFIRCASSAVISFLIRLRSRHAVVGRLEAH